MEGPLWDIYRAAHSHVLSSWPSGFVDEIGDTKDGLLSFFNKHFADMFPLIGEDQLVADYLKDP